MTSYQRLKLKNKELHDEIDKLLTNQDYYYFECSIRHGIKKNLERLWWFGDSNPIGKINGLKDLMLKTKE